MLALIIYINSFAFQSFLGLWCVELQIIFSSSLVLELDQV